MNLRIAKARTCVVLALVCISLVLGGVAQAAPPPDWNESRGTWEDLNKLPPGHDLLGVGIYMGWDDPAYGLDPPDVPIVGGVKTWSWSLLEPDFDGDYRFDTTIGPWIEGEAAHNKKAAIAVAVYNGRDGGVRVPEWLWLQDSNVRLYNPYNDDGSYAVEGFWVLNYLNDTYQDEYQELIEALAQYLDDHESLEDNLSWVNISTGLHTETQPAANSKDKYFYRDVLNWSSQDWVDHVNHVTDFYHGAFTNHCPSITLFLNMAPGFRDTVWERKQWSDHAAALGVGLRNSGLRTDRRDPWIYSNLLEWCDVPSAVPIAWEFYRHWIENESDLYWTVLCGLDKHPDNFTWANDNDPYQGALLSDPNYQPYFELANQYCGVSRGTTPSVWTVLRGRYEVYGGSLENYNFWMWEDRSVPGGETEFVTNVYSFFYSWNGITYYPAEYDFRIDPDPAHPELRAKEGRYCRRTDQPNDPYMCFDIQNEYQVGASEATFKVTYFDYGTDQWRLEYDAIGEPYKALPPVVKTDSGTWKTRSWTVYDARLSDGQDSATDFRINCMNDGDEFIHIVHVTKGSGSTPTHDIPLATGANLISLPLAPADTSVTQVFAGIEDQFSKVYAYDASTTTWSKYDKNGPSFGNTLDNVDESMGLWVYVDSACTLQASGAEPSSTAIPLYTGANLVSWPSMSTTSVDTAFLGIWTQFSKVYAYNAATTTWSKYDKNGPTFGNTLTNLVPGMGLWVYVDANCTWTITN